MLTRQFIKNKFDEFIASETNLELWGQDIRLKVPIGELVSDELVEKIISISTALIAVERLDFIQSHHHQGFQSQRYHLLPFAL
jgi:hypothetical protein